MNDILSKAVEALKAETPDISYIRGMLETLLAMQEPNKVVLTNPAHIPVHAPAQATVVGEVPMPKNMAKIAQVAQESAHD